MEIEILEVAGFPQAIGAMRLPMKSGEKSDSYFEYSDSDIMGDLGDCWYEIGPKDRILSMKLVKAGSSHRKHLRLIDAWIEIQAPLYWWNEFDTYRLGVDKVSESTMHTLTKHEITTDDFELDEWKDPETGDLPKPLEDFIDWIERWRKISDVQKLKEVLPSAYLQTRIVKCSYEALNAMYHDRKNHKLKEWRQFCKALEDLPYSEFITVAEGAMTADEYQALAKRTCSITDDPEKMLMHGVLGLTSEAGEVSGIFQKQYQGHEMNKEHLIKECGDCLWMIAEILTAINVPMSECMTMNIEKLKSRYPEGFTPEKSMHRKPGDI